MKYHSCSSYSFLFLIIIITLVTISSSIIEGFEAQALNNPNRKLVTTLALTRATLTLNSFEQGGDGGDASECDGQFHSDNTLIVALSTRWYNGGSRCFRYININGNGMSVRAMVVDECDTNRDCASDSIVDASKAVWLALGVDENSDNWGEMEVYWSDA